MKTNHRMRGGFTLVELLVVIVIIAALAGLAAPQVIRQRKAADKVEAVSNARQIGLAMLEFENEYGSYPDAGTLTEVSENTGSPLASGGGTDSNSFFRQLLAAGFCQSEKIFYAKIPGTKKPDDDISTASTALEEGEVGFAYMMEGTEGFSAAGNPARPLAVTPLVQDSTDGTFDIDPFDRKAIILRMDNSVSSVNIKQDKTINLSAGKGLKETGPDSVWGENVTSVAVVSPKLK